jgi:hypothetical protein
VFDGAGGRRIGFSAGTSSSTISVFACLAVSFLSFVAAIMPSSFVRGPVGRFVTSNIGLRKPARIRSSVHTSIAPIG